MRCNTLIIVLVTTSTLLLANILFLPPFEGFDEDNHFSYISYLSDEHRIPNFLQTKTDDSVNIILGDLPRRYLPKEQMNDAYVTYAKFFSYDNSIITRAYNNYRTPFTDKISYHPNPTGPVIWQGQHPPLYYTLMIIPYNILKETSPKCMILCLRILSCLFAVISIMIFYRACIIMNSNMFFPIVVSVSYYPSFYYDLARIGNDSLVALLVSLSFYCLIKCMKRCTPTNGMLLAVTVGFGLLTKSFFVPIFAGLIVFLTSHYLASRVSRKNIILNHMTMIVAVSIIYGGWMLYFKTHYGSYFGSNDSWHYAHLSHIPLSFTETIRQMIRGMMVIGATFFWSGTWSFIHRHIAWYLLAVPAGILIVRNVLHISPGIRRPDNQDRQIIPAFQIIALMVGFGFLVYLYQQVAATGFGRGTGGYYLFALWPFTGYFLLGKHDWSASPAKRHRLDRYFMILAFVSLFILEITGHWHSLQVYAGFLGSDGSGVFGNGGIPFTVENFLYLMSKTNGLIDSYTALLFYLIGSALRFFLLVKLFYYEPENPAWCPSKYHACAIHR